ECQKQDWKEHKNSCKAIVPNFEKEYAVKYSNEKNQVKLLREIQMNMQYNEDFINTINQSNSQHSMQRWRTWSDELRKFLSSPRQIGDIFPRTTNLPYFPDMGGCALSFSNTPKNDKLRLSQGKVHVAVGFVDLDLLLQATIMQNEDFVEQPAKFIGYEGSVYAVAKTNVIVEMIIGKATIRSIIEAWFSAVWTKETLEHFKNAVNNIMKLGNAPVDSPPNPTKRELDPEVSSLISHWSKSVESPKSRKNAHKLWASVFDKTDSIFAI
ncbi:9393_t:CDS:1, partial [Acaulospora morrowiae]